MDINAKLVATTVVILIAVYMFWNIFAVIGILFVASLVNGDKFNQLRGQLKEKLITPEMAIKVSKVFGTKDELPFVTPQSAATQPISVF